MICFNYKSDKDNLKDDLNMSNGGTSMFINVLCLSGDRIAETESQKRFMVFLAEKNQTVCGIGTVGFDIVDMPWDRNSFDDDKPFMLRVIEGARHKLGWETLGYVPNEAFVAEYLDKFQKLVESRGGKGYYMRGTFTHHNPDFTKDIFHMADDLGFTELSMEPVVTAKGNPSGLTKEDIETVCQQYEILAKDMIRRKKDGKPITFYHYMIDLEHGPCIYKRVSGCGVGTEYMAVTATGDLYPCHQFVNDPEYKLGNIWDGVQNTEIRDEFKLCNVYAKPDCKNCWARLYCAGGCAANALHATGDIHGTYEDGCTLFKKRMECALMMKVAENE